MLWIHEDLQEKMENQYNDIMKRINSDIYWVGVNDRTTDLFEGVWPLPEGVSYNSYLIDDEKKVLVDSAKSYFEDELLENIEKILDPSEIDYIISHHMEPDHSGAFPTLRRLAPEAEIVCTEKAKDFLESFYEISDGITVVGTGDSLNIGKRELKFFETPFVHWPETMMTYDPSDKILFSGDAFGGFGALEAGIFDDKLDLEFYEDEVLRYFANIVGMYSSAVQAALGKLSDVDVEIVAPTHGPIWRERPERIINLYDKWSRKEGEAGITLVYGSMYGNTAEMMEAVAQGINSAGCKNLRIMDASRVHLSHLLSNSWKRKGLIIGAPTYDARIFPPVDHFLNLAQKKKLKDRIAGIFGSYGWSGGAIDRMKSTIEELDWELVEPIGEFRGKPTEEELEKGMEMGKAVAEKIVE
ncbi:MAG: FprA family A-type flavoprotein [Candidatus Hadarchaeota archaeon]